MKLAQKMIEVMKDCAKVEKNGLNSFHGYKYATAADVLQTVNTALTKAGIATFSEASIIELKDVPNAKGSTDNRATVEVQVTFCDTESDEKFTAKAVGTGLDNGDKAVAKAQTMAIKYLYLTTLAIDTGDDPEADSKTDNFQQPAPAKQNFRQNVSQAQTQQSQSSTWKDTCADCGKKISPRVAEFSRSKHGRNLCFDCQKTAQSANKIVSNAENISDEDLPF